KLVDEETGASKQHIGDPTHALERIVNTLRGGKELMLAHVQLAPLREMDRDDMTSTVAAEGDHAVAARLGDEHLQSRHHALESAFHGLEGNAHRRVLPQQDVVLEVH